MAVSPVLLLTLLACATFSLAAVWRENIDTVTGHEGLCYIADQGKSYKVGKKWSESNCVEATCSTGGTAVTRHSCGSVSCGAPFKKVVDLSASYPDCCPTCVPA